MVKSIAFTGHRPGKHFPGMERVPPMDLHHRLHDFAIDTILRMFDPLDNLEIISGFAEGWDLAVAHAAVQLDIPLVAALPFEGQERYWSGDMQILYRLLRAAADREHVVGPFRDRAFYVKRDEWMVDNAQMLVGLCGKETGGTAYTMRYARRWCVPHVNVWSAWTAIN